MKIGVYTRFWATAGGGEVYAGGIAEALADNHDVVLLCEEPIDIQRLQDRLGLDLEGTDQRTLGHVSDDEFIEATSEFDLLFNCSHGSSRPNGAAEGIYVVHFPDVGGAGPHSMLGALLNRLVNRQRTLRIGHGVHVQESDESRSWRWTEGHAELRATAPRGAAMVLVLDLSTSARPEGREAPLRVLVDGRLFLEQPPSRRTSSVSVPMRGRGEGDPIVVSLEIEPFTPSGAFGGSDDRSLGLQIESARLVSRNVMHRFVRRVHPAAVITGFSSDFLSSYGTFVSNSRFTKRWVLRRWGRWSACIEPPVHQRSPGIKGEVVLSVGRFFDPQSGHSKRQMEMVQAFRSIAVTSPGWELHLVGGCADRDKHYLEQVQAAAQDLPVVFHVNATRDELDSIYARAALYWHATGMGEDQRRHPERFEHFGISVVEAMSSGAVPIVLGAGGPAQIVRDGKDGFHFRTENELIRSTKMLIENPSTRSSLSTSAIDRARDFEPATFRTKLASVVDAVSRPGHGRVRVLLRLTSAARSRSPHQL